MPDSWDSSDGQTQHLDENGNTVGGVDDDVKDRLARNLVEQKDVLDLMAKKDATEGIGVRVWRSDVTGSWHDDEPPAFFGKPYLAIPLDAESLARLREWIADTLIEREYVHLTPDEAADAVLAALGLDDS